MPIPKLLKSIFSEWVDRQTSKAICAFGMVLGEFETLSGCCIKWLFVEIRCYVSDMNGK